MKFSAKAAIAAFSLLCFFTVPVSAAPVDDASKYVESLGHRAIASISNKSLSKEKRKAQIEQLFRENVDINWVGRFVLGRFWKAATDAQKARYLREYEAFLVSHYASRFTDYSSGSFKVTSAHEDGENEFTVSMQIQADVNSKPVAVDYRVRAGSTKGFKVFDVIVEGVSLITTQRSEFSSVVNDKGLDYLITQLANKTIGMPIDRAAE